MSNKKMYIFIACGISVLLFASLYIVLRNPGRKNNEAVIIIGSSVAESETLAESDTEPTKNKKETHNSSKAGSEAQKTKAAETITEAFLYIDINRADAEELDKLEGVGGAISRKIIAYRETNGYFRNIEEIMNVNGIGKVKFEKIKPHIYVENPIYEVTEAASETSSEVTEKAMETHTTTACTTTDKVPKTTETEKKTEAATEAESTTAALTLEDIAPIDINTADVAELMLLPYVDEETAKSIIELREKLDGFRNVYELLYIEELEQKEVAEILDFVIVGQ